MPMEHWGACLHLRRRNARSSAVQRLQHVWCGGRDTHGAEAAAGCCRFRFTRLFAVR